MQPGDRVRVDRGDVTNEGVLLPSTTPDHLVVKLDGGYNVGIDRDAAEIEVLESGVRDVGGEESGDAADGPGASSEVTFDDELPTIALVLDRGERRAVPPLHLAELSSDLGGRRVEHARELLVAEPEPRLLRDRLREVDVVDSVVDGMVAAPEFGERREH